MSKIYPHVVAIVSSGGDIEKARQWLLDRGMIDALAELDRDLAAKAARRAHEGAVRRDGDCAGAAPPVIGASLARPQRGSSGRAGSSQGDPAHPASSRAASDPKVSRAEASHEQYEPAAFDALGDGNARWAFEERAAILEFEGGAPRAEAERLARNMAAALALLERREEDRVIAEWRREVEAAAAIGKPWNVLRAASLAFLDGPYAREAVRSSWPPVELWGVFAGDPVDISFRRDAWGLVSGMALSSFSYRVVAIAGGHAVLETRSGSRHRALRKTSMPEAVVWWHAICVRPKRDEDKDRPPSPRAPSPRERRPPFSAHERRMPRTHWEWG